MNKQPFTCVENERESECPLNSRATRDPNAINSAITQYSTYHYDQQEQMTKREREQKHSHVDLLKSMINISLSNHS